MADLNLDLSSQTLDQRILGFKSDPQKMKDVNDFLNDLIEKARNDAEVRRASVKQKVSNYGNKFNIILYLQNIT